MEEHLPRLRESLEPLPRAARRLCRRDSGIQAFFLRLHGLFSFLSFLQRGGRPATAAAAACRGGGGGWEDVIFVANSRQRARVRGVPPPPRPKPPDSSSSPSPLAPPDSRAREPRVVYPSELTALLTPSLLFVAPGTNSIVVHAFGGRALQQPAKRTPGQQQAVPRSREARPKLSSSNLTLPDRPTTMSLSKLWPPHDHRLLQSILYTNAPFFCYPFKTLLNSKFGGNYAESYKHFRDQHMDGVGL